LGPEVLGSPEYVVQVLHCSLIVVEATKGVEQSRQRAPRWMMPPIPDQLRPVQQRTQRPADMIS